ncbi:MAG: CBS domain-containing protein [Candidatus Hadarchaeota archaeon]|nr:CBS domain-containing protein [Candidatus Hadarchaeota archaeon]
MAELRREVSNFYELKVKEIMQKKGLPLIEKDAPVDHVLSILTEKTHVWVTESKKSKKIVGVITGHDVISILAPGRPTYTFGLPDMRSPHWGTVEGIMSKRLVKCSPNGTMKDVLDKMMKYGVRRLPVMKRNNVIVGEIRLYHIIKKFYAVFRKSAK